MNSQKISNKTVLNQLRWRYAAKQFDPLRRISPEDWSTLEQSLVLTPSSFGLQPWQFIVVTDQHTKEKLVSASLDQRQVAEASHVVVFAIKNNVGPTDVDRAVPQSEYEWASLGWTCRREPLPRGERQDVPEEIHDTILEVTRDLALSGENTPTDLLALQRLADFPARVEYRNHKIEMDLWRKAQSSDTAEHRKRMNEERQTQLRTSRKTTHPKIRS